MPFPLSCFSHEVSSSHIPWSHRISNQCLRNIPWDFTSFTHTFLSKWSWNSAGYMYTVTLKALSFEQGCLNIRNLLHRNVLWYSEEDENNTMQYNKTQHKTWLFKSFFSTHYNLSCLHNRALQLLNFQNCLIRWETINNTPK